MPSELPNIKTDSYFLSPAGLEAAAEAEWTRCRSLPDRKAGTTWDDVSDEVKDAWRIGPANVLLAYYGAIVPPMTDEDQEKGGPTLSLIANLLRAGQIVGLDPREMTSVALEALSKDQAGD